MRIGVMLRAIDERGGVGVYARNITEELLRRDRRNEYVLFYRDAADLGRFSAHERVTERVIRGWGKAAWDQVAIPLACRRAGVDVLFHPKFTAPLLAPCPVVMTVHGADWFIPDQAQYYHPLDVRYVRTVMPWYFRKCARVIAVARRTAEDFRRVLGIPEDKIRPVYFAPARCFRRITDADTLDEVRARHALPKRFILTLTKVGTGGDNRKNARRLLEAYRLYHAAAVSPVPLVVVGRDCAALRERFGISHDGYGGAIHFPGWIEQEDLPAVYSMADMYLYPSNLEAFPIPLTEAMACGTPIVTSNVNGLEEIAGDAAVLVDPREPAEIAEAIAAVVDDRALQDRLRAKGLERSRLFDWDRCAAETLEILEACAAR